MEKASSRVGCIFPGERLVVAVELRVDVTEELVSDVVDDRAVEEDQAIVAGKSPARLVEELRAEMELRLEEPPLRLARASLRQGRTEAALRVCQCSAVRRIGSKRRSLTLDELGRRRHELGSPASIENEARAIRGERKEAKREPRAPPVEARLDGRGEGLGIARLQPRERRSGVGLDSDLERVAADSRVLGIVDEAPTEPRLTDREPDLARCASLDRRRIEDFSHRDRIACIRRRH